MKNWRLEKLVKNISINDIVADIGTDHAFLPIYISKNKLSKKIYASDNKVGPLNIAKENIKKQGIKNIALLFGDGLGPYKNIKIDTFIIAGLGGGTISKIISNINHEKLILEPRNDFDTLREKLKEMKYKIIDEDYIFNNGIHHLFITAKYDGTSNIKNMIDIYIGPILKMKRNKNYNKYIDNLFDKYTYLYKVSKNKKFNKILQSIKEWKNNESNRNI